MNVLNRGIQIALGVLSIPGSVLDMLKDAGRWRYAKIMYPEVVFAKGSYADENCKFGRNTKVYKNALLSRVQLGDCSYIGGDSILKNCTVGKFCAIGPDVRIGIGMHPVKDVISTYPGFYSPYASGVVSYNIDQSISESRPVHINNDVWIGLRSIILDGVTIGDGAIIAAGSVVTKDVDPYSIVGGVPAKLIRERYSKEEANELVNFAWWDKDNAFIQKHSKLFLDSNSFFNLIR